ncbi:MAG: 16S rRNA (guanine(527)-N(7))-methyltransferase RsmG [Nitrospinota bacterium]
MSLYKYAKLIAEEMKAGGIDIGDKEAAILSAYLSELKKWNSKYNLIGLKDDIEIARRLFVSSATFLRLLPQTSPISIVDIGSGAGFPGIPFKILCPELKVTCIDSNKKKVIFLKHVSRVLPVDISATAGRAEEIKAPGGGYDCAVAHSVGTIDLLVQLSFPLLRDEGILIMRKGEELEEELRGINLQSNLYSVEARVGVSPRGEEPYTLVSIKKCST